MVRFADKHQIKNTLTKIRKSAIVQGSLGDKV